VTQICQDEAPNFENVAAWAVDASGVGTSAASIRAQRSGTRTAPGNGRVYHIYFTSSTCTGHVTLGVPTVAGGTAGDNGALYNSSPAGRAPCRRRLRSSLRPRSWVQRRRAAAVSLAGAGLQVGPISQLTHPTIPAGMVMSQKSCAWHERRGRLRRRDDHLDRAVRRGGPERGRDAAHQC
jgi:hypothetical protein